LPRPGSGLPPCHGEFLIPVLELCNPRAYIIALGDTAPLAPILFDHGLNVISGTRVMHAELSLRCLSEGANFRQIRGVSRLTMMRWFIDMTFNPDTHRRRSIRLRGYDYTRAGAYFTTICTRNPGCMFGEIADRKMVLNPAGSMIQIVWDEIPFYYTESKSMHLPSCPTTCTASLSS
jgi:hypothetical protein